MLSKNDSCPRLISLTKLSKSTRFQNQLIYNAKCSRSIRIPITIKINPPMILILFPKKSPKRHPKKKPNSDNEKVTKPIIKIGSRMDICRNAKLKPTINASMLVATDKLAPNEA